MKKLLLTFTFASLGFGLALAAGDQKSCAPKATDKVCSTTDAQVVSTDAPKACSSQKASPVAEKAACVASKAAVVAAKLDGAACPSKAAATVAVKCDGAKSKDCSSTVAVKAAAGACEVKVQCPSSKAEVVAAKLTDGACASKPGVDATAKPSCGTVKASACGTVTSGACGTVTSGACGTVTSGACGTVKSGACGTVKSGACGTLVATQVADTNSCSTKVAVTVADGLFCIHAIADGAEKAQMAAACAEKAECSPKAAQLVAEKAPKSGCCLDSKDAKADCASVCSSAPVAVTVSTRDASPMASLEAELRALRAELAGLRAELRAMRSLHAGGDASAKPVSVSTGCCMTVKSGGQVALVSEKAGGACAEMAKSLPVAVDCKESKK